MKSFIQPLTEYSEIIKINECIASEKLPIRITGCTDSQKCNLIAAVSDRKRARLIVAQNDMKAKELLADYQLYDKNVMYYPAKDIIFYSADIRGNAIVKERMRVIKQLANRAPVTVITSFDSGFDKLLPLHMIKESAIRINNTDCINTEELTTKLIALGYERQGQVEAPGEFAVRGGIIDIFPLTEDTPCRIELWGDEIDSIRIFDAASQRSIENIESIDIFPAAEFIPEEGVLRAGLSKIDAEADKYISLLRSEMKTEEAARVRRSVNEFKENIEYLHGSVGYDSYMDYFVEETVSFFDYFNEDDCVIFLDEPARLMEKGSAVFTEFSESMTGRLEKGYIIPGQMNAIFDYKQIMARLSEYPTVMLSTMDYKFQEIPVINRFDLTVKSMNSYNNDFELLVKELLAWKRQGYRVILLTNSRSRAVRLAEDLVERELNAFYSDNDERMLQNGEIMVSSGSVRRGFEYPLIKFAVISESDIFGAKKQRAKKKVYEGSRIQNFAELNTGDYVVHESYGVGIYRGIEKIEVDHVVKDYIKVEYGGGGTLYVLATAMGALQKYAGSDAKPPKLNKLNSVEWKNTKTRVKKAVKEIAGELVRLYALRQAKKGFAYGKDTVWQKEFEELFPYDETDDQLKAIEDTKRDMESTKIMDRLVCGDVGYGKTEIAIRAAFKAVQDGKQVVFLVPTTILAQQHYNTFEQRMRDFPISIDMLSRFKTAAEQKKIIQRLKSGQLDILIGTHRVLSKDIEFKNLGLLIVDEEQRFGVTHKEKIKQLKGDVDVLTLTATPIPRTLHMSLIGIRDMSVLDEAPVDRLPIQTFVLEHNDELIREAINRELSRGGQVYYVYNRVQGIEDIASGVAKLVPDANVAYAHGQMNEHELERIMFSFINGEIDVLVSTTIIETGLDISNVNTIIIADADKLGLSQLYQLRGRVGRSNRTAYAFLMYKRDKLLKEIAEKRLAAIKEFTELGSGFKIAMRDLEIRGAGNLLGAEQSGHMEAVGYDLYCKMLNEAVKTMKLGDTEEDEGFETTIDMDMDAYIPSSYIKNEVQKLDMYKRIANIESNDDLLDMQEELVDRYGDIPVAVNNLLHIALTKAAAHSLYITGVNHRKNEVRLDLYARARLNVEGFPKLLEHFGKRLRLNPGAAPYLEYTLLPSNAKKKNGYTAAEAVFTQLKDLFDVMTELLIEPKK